MLMPTALQRIKGLTTGFLPTFVDIGESFGGSVIVEDSLLHHAVKFVRLFIVSACSYSNSNPRLLSWGMVRGSLYFRAFSATMYRTLSAPSM